MKKSWRYDRAEDGGDIDTGYAHVFEHKKTGDTREFSIETAAGPPAVPYSRVREVLRKCLDEEDPPRRVRLDRDGNEMQ